MKRHPDRSKETRMVIGLEFRQHLSSLFDFSKRFTFVTFTHSHKGLSVLLSKMGVGKTFTHIHTLMAQHWEQSGDLVSCLRTL